MKNNAIVKLIKDLLLVVVIGLIATIALSGKLGTGNALAASLFVVGIPFGWRTVSKIITAVSIHGIVIKLIISVCFGWLIVPVVLISDIVRCFIAKVADAA